MRKITLLITISLILMFILLQSAAHAITISNEFVWTDNIGPNGGFMPAGQYFYVGAFIMPSGPGTTAQAQHTSGSGPNYNLQFIPQPIYPDLYFAREPYTGQSGRWNINAQRDPDTASVTTHLMDNPQLLPLASNLAASGSLLTPTLSWDNIYSSYPTFVEPPITLETDFYQLRVRVRLAQSDMLVIFESLNLPTDQTSYTIPNGFLVANQNYLLDLMLMHFDTEEIVSTNPWVYITANENRSETFLNYSTTPVPEPATMLLVGSGLIGLAGYGRKKFFKK